MKAFTEVRFKLGEVEGECIAALKLPQRRREHPFPLPSSLWGHLAPLIHPADPAAAIPCGKISCPFNSAESSHPEASQS